MPSSQAFHSLERRGIRERCVLSVMSNEKGFSFIGPQSTELEQENLSSSLGKASS